MNKKGTATKPLISSRILLVFKGMDANLKTSSNKVRNMYCIPLSLNQDIVSHNNL